MALGRGALQIILQVAALRGFAGIEQRDVPADGLIRLIAVNARRARIPRGNAVPARLSK